MAKKKRLDKLLVEKGFYKTRSRAKRAIMAGKIFINDQCMDKAGTNVDENSEIVKKGEEIPYVSRGGLKLEKAIEVFDIDIFGKEVIDIGASTGGFTDCLLQNGAKKVYAIDVGYGQLAWKLRQDKRVKVIERTNFRYLTRDKLDITVPLIVTDVSFISLRLIVPQALNFLKNDGDFIALIKPQFEAGPARVGNKGLVNDVNIHEDILNELSDFFINKNLYLVDLNFSPITGASSKNIEFIIHIKKIERNNDILKWKKIIKNVVEDAHLNLERG